MIVLNFSHPLTDAQRRQIEGLSRQPVEDVIDIPTEFDTGQPFAPQCVALVDGLGLSPAQWQGTAWLVILPSLNFIAAALLAELHGRMGYFPTIVRTRPLPGSTPTVYEVAELINLQQMREQARTRRKE
ncbi:MAG: CRISPR-associated protein Csx15 [Anaerolineae bacterium]